MRTNIFYSDAVGFKAVMGIIRSKLNAGTDKGSTQAVIDTKDFAEVAEEIVLFYKTLLKA